MSYLRYGHPLQWFKGDSTEYVFGCGEGQIEDYNSGYDDLPSLVELIGHTILWQTNDFDYTTKIVVTLAYRLGIKNKLRLTEHPHDEMEKSRGHDYREEIKRWMWRLDLESDVKSHGGCHMKDDDLSDFDYLETFTDEELHDVKM